jgi:surface antigen
MRPLTRTTSLAFLLALLLSLLGACATKSGTGTAVGAGGGAIVGGALGGSTGALIGAAIGGIGGYAVGRQMEIEDQRRVALALEQNRAMYWENPDTGHEYSVQPTRTVYERGRECREFRMVGDVNGRPDEVYGTACRAPDGSWQMVSG